MVALFLEHHLKWIYTYTKHFEGMISDDLHGFGWKTVLWDCVMFGRRARPQVT